MTLPIRNVAIIAHVDHGKTTLVDALLKQSGTFREGEEVPDCVMDSNTLERERGITILSKNTAVHYGDTLINIVDTPGHADFGGEVERVLGMVDGCILIVDANEGPMPQTRFVLKKALEKGLRPIVVVNKIDRPQADPFGAIDKVLDLFLELGADDDQCEFPYLFASGLSGYAKDDLEDEAVDMKPLFEAILRHVPPPVGDLEKPLQLQVTTLDYSEYLGRIVIGRIHNGSIKAGQQAALVKEDGSIVKAKITKLLGFEGLKRVEMEEASAGHIVAVSGFSDANIGETITCPNEPQALPLIKVDEPTLQMTFWVNDSPFAGQEGSFVTSRQLRDRLMRELETNVALRVEETDSPDKFAVSGRGELHLGILIETMRREGYEFAVSRPEVIFHYTEEGQKLEPIETAYVEVHEDYLGIISDMLGRRKAQMTNIRYTDGGTVYAEYLIPTRGLLGFRQSFLTATRGTGIYHTLFHAYSPYLGEIDTNELGSLVSMETGPVMTYALQQLASRGTFFVRPGENVYVGQVVGEHIRNEELVVNVCKAKHLTNHRDKPSSIDGALTPPRIMSLDEAIEYLHDDELLEVTPVSLRIRKRVLDAETRIKTRKRAEKDALAA